MSGDRRHILIRGVLEILAGFFISGLWRKRLGVKLRHVQLTTATRRSSSIATTSMTSAEEQATEERAESRQTGASDTKRLFDHSPYGWLDVSKGFVFWFELSEHDYTNDGRNEHTVGLGKLAVF